VSSAWRPLRAGLGWLLLPLGQNSLLAYSLHLFVVLGAATVLPLIPGFDAAEPIFNTCAQLAGIGVIWVVVGAVPLLRRTHSSLTLPSGASGGNPCTHWAEDVTLCSQVFANVTGNHRGG